MNINVAKSDKLKTLLSAIVLAAIVLWIGQPAVEAATRAVRLKGAAKIKDSSGDNLTATNMAELGALNAPGAAGALDVRTLSGGGGFLGTGDCDAVAPPASRPNTTTVAAAADTVVTGLIITGPGVTVSVAAPDLDQLIGPGPVVNFSTTAENPNEVVAFGNGLTVFPSELVFTCTGGTGNYVILGN